MRTFLIGIAMVLGAAAWAEDPATSPLPEAGALTAPAPADDVVTVTGKIRAGFDDHGQLTSLKLIDNDGSDYHLMLTPENLPLAELNGRTITVIGTINIDVDVQWLKVSSYQLQETLKE